MHDGIHNAIALSDLDDPRSASASLGNGREISAQDTVPFALWTASKYLDDYVGGFWATACVGGDIDTNCAIVGGIIAARVGAASVPDEWAARAEPLPAWANAELDLT